MGPGDGVDNGGGRRRRRGRPDGGELTGAVSHDDAAHDAAVRTAGAVLDRYPRSYAEELGITSLRTPSPLYRLLVMATLMSARIRASVAVDAARALHRQRWDTARSMASVSWEERTRVINRSGYARYDERTSTMLADTAELLLDRYRGDLRRLREEAGRDPAEERRLIKECKGIGDVGADIFFREVQREWSEVSPFADARALGVARRLGLGSDARGLARLVGAGRMHRLASGLVRVDLEGAYDEVLATS